MEPEESPTIEVETEPEEFVVSETDSDFRPEDSISREPDNAVPREPEVVPVPELMETPEVVPAPESMETPETTPVPEYPETPDMASTLEPMETPEVPIAPVQHEHSWLFQSFYQEPTCSNGGLVNQICAHCGETQTTPGTPTGKHVYEVETAGDCCTAEVVICRECNHREVREKNRKNHIDEEEGFCYGCGQKTD